MKKSSKSKSNLFERNFFPFKQRWPFIFVFLFFVIRLILNIEMKPLQIFFFVSYVILILVMFAHKKSFLFLSVMFLYLDSLIGTYIFTMANNLGAEYFGTMMINGVVFLILIFDRKGNFK